MWKIVVGTVLYSWWTLFFFFLFPSAGLCCVLYVGHKLISSCIALVFHTICLHSYFLVSRTDMGAIESPSIFCSYVVAPSVYRASTLRDRVHEQSLFVLQESLPKCLRTVTSSFDYPVDIKGSKIPRIKLITVIVSEARGGVVVKALRYKPAGRGFDSRWCHWKFSVT
jgi:hypothetical protein